ncbi:putative Ig domain-containing protein [Streptomyces sp. H27-D2]|uniref:putative Ig domain-containing protein n=1 Tax=Streptomyces sp. H27-D2 TaxID=3046304 RepID=UPI002DBBF118|nr:putative Ig domain-containing protein [Streptomyces sp. H27-D2]MEC4018583.1 putative Ig domain-containing protein [Streptomyces sp. H27-D2]
MLPSRSAAALLAAGALVTALCSLPSPATATPAAPAAPTAAAEPRCTLPAGLAELSGLALSSRHPGVLYAVNDSGNTNQVFAVDCTGATGRLRATYTLTGATNTDWEALTIGKDPSGNPVIHVGDIGDNFGSRAELTVYSFPEPATLTTSSVTPATTRLAYSDGKHDAESLLADPVTGRLYVASKLIGAAGQLYQAPLPTRPGELNTLTPVRPGPVFATDGAFSPNGKSYVLRSGGPIGANTAYVYSAAGAKLAEVALPAQSQGETVTYADCASLLVGSENDTQIWRVPLPPEATPGCGTQPPDGVLSVANPGPQSCKFNQTCAVQITAAGGTPPRKYSAAGLPFGLAIDATTGRITGKTWQTGTFQITATATDTAQASASTTFPLTVNWF